MSENLTTQSKSQNSFMKGLSKIRKSRFFLPIMFLTCLRVLAPLTLMSYIAVTNWMNQSPEPQSGQELIMDLLKERSETGRIYIMNIDHCNDHSSFKDKVSMSNLCQEITLPTEPINHIDAIDGEIALCILSAINVGKLTKLDELEDLCDLSVRSLEELIDYQDYPVKAQNLPHWVVDPLEWVILVLHIILLRMVGSTTHKTLGCST